MVWHPRTEQIYAEDFINSSLYEVMFDYVIVSELDNRCWPKVSLNIYIQYDDQHKTHNNKSYYRAVKANRNSTILLY